MSTPLRSVRVRTDVTRVLVVTAHPDDVDFGAAGTVATWTASGNSSTKRLGTVEFHIPWMRRFEAK